MKNQTRSQDKSRFPTRVIQWARRFPVLSCGVLSMMVFLAFFAETCSPYDPTKGDLRRRYIPPVWMETGDSEHLLGTDAMGRDVLSRLIHGTRISLAVGFTAVVVAGTIGMMAGILSGFLGGWTDQVIMRLNDTWLSMPALLFAIFLAMVLGPGVSNLIIVLGLIYWTRYARVVRSEVLSLKERDFISLARVAGCSNLKIMYRHIVPNILNSTWVIATLLLGTVIMAEAGLSFLGLGVPPPYPAWGSMLSEALPELFIGRWWLTVFPGLCIMLVVFSANMFGDWLRIRLDPQISQL